MANRFLTSEQGKLRDKLRAAVPGARNVRKIVEPLDPRRELPEGLKWFVLTTEPKKEFHIAHWIEDCGWQSLVPLQYRLRAVTRHGRGRNIKRNKVEMPVIPRIVIAGFGGLIPWLQIEEHRYITGVLGVGGMPIPMRPGEAERLRTSSEALLMPSPGLTVGDKARITTPTIPDAHRVVEVRSLIGRHATVIQSWFGVDREVRIEAKDLEVIPSADQAAA